LFAGLDSLNSKNRKYAGLSGAVMIRAVNVRAIVVQGLSILVLCAFIELGAGFALKSMRDVNRAAQNINKILSRH
jgi:hypothetical protein